MQSERSLPELAGLSAQERRILGSFVANEKVVVRAEDVQGVHPVSRKAANLLLSRLHRKGWLRRLKRGVYGAVPLESETTQPAIEDAWLLAMKLFAPCYISGWSAAEHWDLTEQIFNSVSLVTGHPQRTSSQTIAGVQFTTRTIAPGVARIVVPYSLRHASIGNILLYAYELLRGGRQSDRIKAFKVDEIQAAAITDRPFRPRYRVEM